MVEKAVTFARKLGLPIVSIVKSISGFVCPKYGARIEIFKSGGGRNISDELGVPFLGSMPVDLKVCEDSEEEISFITKHKDSAASKASRNS